MNEQIVTQRLSVQQRNQDGETTLTLQNQQSRTTEVLVKGQTTGKQKREWVIKNTAKQVAAGEVALMQGDEGEARPLVELRVVQITYSPEALAAKREAETLKTFASNLRKRLGLSKSKQTVAERDKLSAADVSEWMLGKRKVMGKDWDSLPAALQKDCTKIHDEAAKVATGAAVKAKAISPTELAKQAVAALVEQGGDATELQQQLDTLLARQAKGKAAASKAKEGDVELTEQGID